MTTMTPLTLSMLLNIIANDDSATKHNQHKTIATFLMIKTKDHKEYTKHNRFYAIKQKNPQSNNPRGAKYARRYRNNHQQRPKPR